MNISISRILIISVSASLILYCGTVVSGGVQMDARANDAGANDAGVCDCPIVPICVDCPVKMEFSGVFGEDFSEIIVGTIPDFDPDSDRGLPVVQRWYFHIINEVWTQGAFHTVINREGEVIVSKGSPEYTNREFRVVLIWVGMNPGL